MVDSLSSPLTSKIRDPNAWISGTPEWIEYFGLSLSAHHGTTIDALGLNGYQKFLIKNKNEFPERYQLIEIPTAIFHSLQNSTLSQFDSDGPRVYCSYGGQEHAAEVVLDRSDAKITIRNINLGVCSVHAEWELSQTRGNNPGN